MDSATKYEQLKEQLTVATEQSFREAEVSMQIAELMNEIEKTKQQIAESDAKVVDLGKKIDKGLIKFKVAKENHLLVRKVLHQQNDTIITLKEEISQKLQAIEDRKALFEEMLNDYETKCEELKSCYESSPSHKILNELKSKRKAMLLEKGIIDYKINEQLNFNKLRNEIRDRLFYAPFIEFGKWFLDYRKKEIYSRELVANTQRVVERTKQLKLECARQEKNKKEAKLRKAEEARKICTLQIPRRNHNIMELSTLNESMILSPTVENDFDEDFNTQPQQLSQFDTNNIYKSYKPITYQSLTKCNVEQEKAIRENTKIEEPPKKTMKMSDDEVPQPVNHSISSKRIEILSNQLIRGPQTNASNQICSQDKKKFATQEMESIRGPQINASDQNCSQEKNKFPAQEIESIRGPQIKASNQTRSQEKNKFAAQEMESTIKMPQQISYLTKSLSQQAVQEDFRKGLNLTESLKSNVAISPILQNQKATAEREHMFEDIIGEISQNIQTQRSESQMEFTQLQEGTLPDVDIQNKAVVKVSPYFKTPTPGASNNAEFQLDTATEQPLGSAWNQNNQVNFLNANQENLDYNYEENLMSPMENMPLSPFTLDPQNEYGDQFSPPPMDMNMGNTSTKEAHSPPNFGFNFPFGQTGFGSVFGGESSKTKSFFSMFTK